MNRRSHAVGALRWAVPAALAVAVLALGPSAGAQTPGRVQGRVVNGTSNAPVESIEVLLQLFSAQADLGVLTTTTDAKGRFAFEDLPDGTEGYQLAAEYGGGVYRSIATAFTAGQTTDDVLNVWEPTSDPTAVTLTDYIVWVDREGDGVAVQHDFAWSNGVDTAYVGDPAGAVMTVPLPAGATGFQYLGTFLENPGEVTEQAFSSDAPIVPGPSSATIRYNAPPLTALTLEIPFATTSLQLFVPQDVTVTAKALRLAGTVTDNGITYQVYAASDIAAATSIDVAMSQAEGAGGGGSAMWILLVAFAAIAVVGLAAWLLARRRTSRGRSGARASRSAARPVRAKARAVEPRSNGRAPRPAPEGNGRTPEVEPEDPDLIVEEIAALDLSFDRGLLEERAYKRLRVAAKDRLLRAEGARAKGGRTR